MSSLLAGLEELGLDNVSKMDVYGDIEAKNKKTAEHEEKKEKTEDPGWQQRGKVENVFKIRGYMGKLEKWDR